MAGSDDLDADGAPDGDAGEHAATTARWPARWLQPGRIAWVSFVVVCGGLVLVGAPLHLAMIPAAVCAGVNLAVLRMDERILRPHVPDTVPAAWSGIVADADQDPGTRGGRRYGPEDPAGEDR